MQNGKKLEIATQIQKCVAVFATHKEGRKLLWYNVLVVCANVTEIGRYRNYYNESLMT